MRVERFVVTGCHPEEVRHGDVTTQELMCVECNYCRPVQVYFSLRGILLPLFFEACTGASPVNVLKVQSHFITALKEIANFTMAICTESRGPV